MKTFADPHQTSIYFATPRAYLRVNSDMVQNVGQGQNLDHLRTPLI